jgi:hypothetical protein
MNEGYTDKEAVSAEQEAPLKTPYCNIFCKLQRYGFRKFPSLIPYADRRKILRLSRERDEKENSKTEPPLDETVDLRCIWAVEFYMPSQVANLLRGFEKLGWNTDDTTISQISPTRWIQQLRETAHGGGWFNLGPISRPGNKNFFHIGRTSPLPPEVEYAIAAMYSMTSSITCIVIGFILDKKYSGRLDESLRRKRQTVLEPLTGGGYRLPGPTSQKVTDIRAIRTELRESAANWFRTHLPGIFASGLLEDEFPTCEFMTLRKARPFPKESERNSEEDEWLRLLDIDRDINAWVADGMLGLKFVWPLLRDEKKRFHAIVAAKEDAFSADELRGYGGGDRSSYVIYVDRRVNGLLSRWALLGVLAGFERHHNKIRDSAIFRTSQQRKSLRLLGEFYNNLSQSVDINAMSMELGHFAGRQVSFEQDVEVFRPSNFRFYRNKEITLSQELREQIAGRSKWLENTDRSVRDLLCQYSTVLGTRENIRLQNSISRMTWWIVFLTFVIATLTALTVYSAIKSGEIFWIW